MYTHYNKERTETRLHKLITPYHIPFPYILIAEVVARSCFKTHRWSACACVSTIQLQDAFLYPSNICFCNDATCVYGKCLCFSSRKRKKGCPVRPLIIHSFISMTLLPLFLSLSFSLFSLYYMYLYTYDFSVLLIHMKDLWPFMITNSVRPSKHVDNVRKVM